MLLFYVFITLTVFTPHIYSTEEFKEETDLPYKQIGDDVEIMGLGSFEITTRDRKLSIAIRRLKNLYSMYWFCIGPIEGSHAGCPVGYQRLHFEGNNEYFTIISEFNRDTGVFVNHKYTFYLYKLVNETIKIHVNKEPDGMSVKLLQSTVVIPPPPTESAMTPLTITLIVIGCAVVLVIVIIIGMVIWSHYRAKKQAEAAAIQRQMSKRSKRSRSRSVPPAKVSHRQQRSSNRPSKVIVTPTSPYVQSSESDGSVR